jgi:hypothetical protein
VALLSHLTLEKQHCLYLHRRSCLFDAADTSLAFWYWSTQTIAVHNQSGDQPFFANFDPHPLVNMPKVLHVRAPLEKGH